MTPDNARLTALYSYAVMDTPPDQRFDLLTQLAARVLNMPMATVMLVDDQRVWCKSAVGAIEQGSSTRRDVAFCPHVLLNPEQPLVVPDTARDRRFEQSPLVTGAPRVRFYAGAALRDLAGHTLGTLCVFDIVPRALSDAELATLVDLAAAVSNALELHRKVVELNESEANYRAASELTPQIPWTADAAGERLEFSATIADATGLTAGQMATRGWRGIAHPDELPDLERRWTQALCSGEPMDIEHRIRVRDGSFRWYRTYAAPRRTAEGAILRWYGTCEDVTDRRDTHAEVLHLAYHDSLTGLPNRARFGEILDQRLAQAAAERPVALLLIDLDNFKQVNDTYGHPAGDALLQAVASRLSGCVRMPDVASRLGGDEFAVIMSLDPVPPDSSLAAERFARRILHVLTAPLDLGGQIYTPRASIGVAIGAGRGVDPQELLRSADLALYRAKHEGRNDFRLFAPEMDEVERARNALKRDLDLALQRDEFELVFQPIVDLRSGRIRSFESLLRWRHPRLGLISPAAFMAVAEQTGLIVPIGAWALRQACRAARSWPADISIAVNLCSMQFRDRGLLAMVTEALEEAALDPQRLEFEITESMLMLGDENDLHVLAALRELGVRISLDDFGTGYSSLSYLHRFKFDKLKIDRSFINRTRGDDEHRAIIRAITSMSRALSIPTVGEGVETQEQFDLLCAEGCDLAQGYLLSRPISAAEARQLLVGRGGEPRRAQRDGTAAR